MEILQDSIVTDTLKIKDSVYHFQHTLELTNGADSSQLWTNLITIILALIASLIALYQVKSNIISSSRIKWIENLRNDISSYTTEIANCSMILERQIAESKGKSEEEMYNIAKLYYDDYTESHMKSDVLAQRIFLYLNSEEEDHKKIEELINKISLQLHRDDLNKLDGDLIDQQIEKIIQISKRIIKVEWEKSKKIFRI